MDKVSKEDIEEPDETYSSGTNDQFKICGDANSHVHKIFRTHCLLHKASRMIVLLTHYVNFYSNISAKYDSHCSFNYSASFLALYRCLN